MTLRIQRVSWCALLLAAAVTLAPGQTVCAADSDAARDKERKLVETLRSNAAPGEKAIACKRLAVYGSREAVPALANLLTDADLASWARIALEAIPDSAADYALRQAMSQVRGKLLVGLINSLGVRRDVSSVAALEDQLKNPDADVASAAAEALGKIGSHDAARVLDPLLDTAPAAVRSSVAYGSLLCAEQTLAEGMTAEAVRAFDRIRQANVPKQRKLEALRGAILARQSAGLPLLLEQLRAEDKALLAIGLRTARELPGRDVTEALAAELDRANADRQGLLLLALSDRSDAAVLPKMLQVAQNGPKNIRPTALGLLDRYRDIAAVPVLLSAAAESDSELARPAKAALARLGGKEVEADLVARLPQATGKTRQALIDLARQRRIAGALPAVLTSMNDADADVRRAAIETVGVLGGAPEVAKLAQLLPKSQAQERVAVEKALVAICGKSGAPALPQILPLAQNPDTGVRQAALRTLAAIGGPEALAAVKTALDDASEAVQDEAVSTLANWPNTWPDDAGVAQPLLALAKSGKKTSHQIQALQGYLLYVQEDKKLTSQDKLAKLDEAAPVIKTPEAKRLVISVLGTVPAAGSLQRLTALAEDDTVSEEACLALVRTATDRNLRDASREQRRGALEAVLKKAKSEGTRKRAQDALQRLR